MLSRERQAPAASAADVVRGVSGLGGGDRPAEPGELARDGDRDDRRRFPRSVSSRRQTW
jgi:hypothetical protein